MCAVCLITTFFKDYYFISGLLLIVASFTVVLVQKHMQTFETEFLTAHLEEFVDDQ